MVDINEASSFVPKVWSQAMKDYVGRAEPHLASFWLDRAERECQWHEDWDSVKTPDGQRFKASEATVVLLRDDGAEFIGGHVATPETAALWVLASKVVTRTVGDADAQTDLDLLLAKWAAEGKAEIATALRDYSGDGCGCCSSSSDSIFSVLTREVIETVERRERVEDCTFYSPAPSEEKITVSIPRYESIKVEPLSGILGSLTGMGYTFDVEREKLHRIEGGDEAKPC